jgi:hypothetical protein
MEAEATNTVGWLVFGGWWIDDDWPYGKLMMLDVYFSEVWRCATY